jgi:hypothetical protein
MTAEVRIPSQAGVKWTPEAAATAIGKPLLDRPTDGEQIGKVVAADVVDGDLVLRLEIDGGGIVGFDLADEEVRCVSLGPRQPFVAS